MSYLQLHVLLVALQVGHNRGTVFVSTNLCRSLALHCRMVGIANFCREYWTAHPAQGRQGFKYVGIIYKSISQGHDIVDFFDTNASQVEIQTVNTRPMIAECCPPPAT